LGCVLSSPYNPFAGWLLGLFLDIAGSGLINLRYLLRIGSGCFTGNLLFQGFYLMTEIASSHNSSSSEPRKGLVQIFTGDGKGKTSAALGTVIRALGQGLKVCIVVFMKGHYPYSEWAFLSRVPDVRIERFGFETFTDPTNVKLEEKEEAAKALASAREAVLGGEYDLVVLDELNIAVAWKLVELDEVVKLIQDKPQNVELILTGRNADAKLVQMADLVTECLKIKHPFDKGIMARKGIDY